jgi:Alpha-glucosidases, family 31 of glycosyl hydrolases
MDKIKNSFILNQSKKLSNIDSIIKGEKYRFTVLTERLIRLEYSEFSKFTDNLTVSIRNREFPKPEFNIIDTSTTLEIETKYFHIVYEKEAPLIGPSNNPSMYFYAKINNTDEVWYPNKKDNENIRGNYRSLNDNLNGETLFSRNKYAVIDESLSPVIDENGYFNFVDNKTDIYLFVYNNDFSLALQDYLTLTGKASLIPKYSFGNILVDNRKINSENVIKTIEEFKNRDIYLSTYILGDFQKENTVFLFDKDRFENPKELTKNIHKMGIFLGIKVNPQNGFNENELNYVELRKFLSPDNNNLIPCEGNDAKFIDTYIKALIRPIKENGIDFIMNDYEGDIYSMWGLNHYTYLNEARKESTRGFIISKNSTISPHLYPITYTGDYVSSFENLEKIVERQNAYYSNLSIMQANLINGSSNYINNPNLYIRSLQYNIFSPVSILEFSDLKYNISKPWEYGGEYLNLSKELLNLRQRLVPFLYSEYYNYSHKGFLMFQPLYFSMPDALKYKEYKKEYYLANTFLVVPIVKDFVRSTRYTKVDYFLPKGNWYNYFSSEFYEGAKKYSSYFRIDEYPIFVRPGSVIVKNNDLYPYSYTNPKNLLIEFFPGAGKTYMLYEDDGISQKYLEGNYMKTQISYRNELKEYTIDIKPIEGKSGVIPEFRNYTLVFKNIKNPSLVLVKTMEKTLPFSIKRVGKDIIIDIKNINTLELVTIKLKSEDMLENLYMYEDNVNIDNFIKDLEVPNNLKDKVKDILLSNDSFTGFFKRLELKKLGLSNVMIEKILELKKDLK